MGYTSSAVAGSGGSGVVIISYTTIKINDVAGMNGITGYSGDGGAATSARLNGPFGVTFDSSATHLYFCEPNNNAVRMVNINTGIISTFAGNGGNVTSGNGGPATAAGIYSP